MPFRGGMICIIVEIRYQLRPQFNSPIFDIKPAMLVIS